MSTDVLLRALAERWRALAWWAAGLLAYVVFVTALWPSVRDSADMQDAVEDYPEAFKAFFGGETAFDLSTGSGFLQAQLFSLVVPLLLTIFAVGFAARTLAGEEEDGRLDLLLAHPASRRAALLEKAGAVLLGVLALGLVTWLTLLGMGVLVDLEVGITQLLAAVLGASLAAGLYGGAALLAGAATGRRGLALGAGGMVFGVAYVLVVVAELAEGASWMRYLSPHHYGVGSDALTDVWPYGAHVVLAVLIAVVVGGAVYAFERRDLAT